MNEEAKQKLLNIFQDRTEGNMKLRSAEVLKQNPDLLDYCWEITEHSPHPENFRSAWCFDYFTELFPQYSAPYVERAIHFSMKTKESGIARQLLRFLNRQELSEEQIFSMLEFCESNCLDPQVPAAVRVHSLELLKKFCLFQPDFRSEIELILAQDHLFEQGSLIARRRAIRKELKL